MATRERELLKGVPVKMSGFVFTFCVFPTSFNASFTGSLPENLQAMLECPKLGFYPKLCVDLVDLSSRDQKQKRTFIISKLGQTHTDILRQVQI